MRVRNLVLSLLFVCSAALMAFPQSPKPADKWAKFGDIKLHYYDVGKTGRKDALVLIHGWTCSADLWKDNYEGLTKYRVIVIDLPGHGRSDKPKLNYSMEQFARAVHSVLDAAGVKRAVLAGHSMGTPVARQFYRLYPGQTLALISVDGSLIPAPFLAKGESEKFIGPLRSNYKENSAKFVDGMLTPIKDDLTRKTIRDTMLATPDYVGISAMEGMADESIWTTDKVNVPVLAVLAASPFWPPDVKERFAAIAPNLEFHMWTGVSHFLQMERPTEFNDSVKSFIVRNKLL